MDEKLAEALERASQVMHWLGKYDVANALVLLCRLVKAEGFNDLDDFHGFVERSESGAVLSQWTRDNPDSARVRCRNHGHAAVWRQTDDSIVLAEGCDRCVAELLAGAV